MTEIANDFYCSEVLNGKIKVEIVYETKNILAFYHTLPRFPIHIIVIPKLHSLDLTTFIENHNNLLGEMLDALKIIIQKITNENGGCKLTTNFGKYQETKHLHWHIYVNTRE